MSDNPLPISGLLPQLRNTLAQRTQAVLQAPPGAGKTTGVPLALLNEEWLAGRKILLLEPRRLAARGAARRMAQTLGEAVGGRVGYRMRLETRVSTQTRIEVVTEGILSRLLQRDPALEDVGLVIFDEFHERSLQADLGLALCLDSQSGLREDLRLLVMSATLDGTAVAALMDGAPVLTSRGRSYPVSVHYQPVSAAFTHQWPDFCRQCAQAVAGCNRHHAGSVLVFLPGSGEIRRVHQHLQDLLAAEIHGGQVRLAPLHGQLSGEEQDLAIQPAPPGQRKIVLATSIAETSLTIEGVEVVVDAGLMRLPRFDPNTGLTRLVTERVSQAAADQRAGRAGRLGPGVCYRLWSDNTRLQAYSPAEIRHADLAPLALELAQWGVRDAGQLRWLDPPPPGPLAQAHDLLRQLQAIDTSGALTRHGAQLNRLGTHPRLAHMMLRGHALGWTASACTLAALLEERDPWRASNDSNLAVRLEQLLQPAPRAVAAGADRGALRRIREQARRWQQQLAALGAEPALQPHSDRAPPGPANTTQNGAAAPPEVHHQAGILLAYAYPDRIARRRAGDSNAGASHQRRYLLSNGRGAWLAADDALGAPEFLVAAWLDGEREARIRLAAPLTQAALAHYHRALITTHEIVDWDEREQAVSTEKQQRVGAWVLNATPLDNVTPDQIQQALIHGLRRLGLNALPWDEASQSLRQRLAFLHQVAPQHWPAVDDTTLMAELEHWLLPYLTGMSRLSHLRRLALADILRQRLEWSQQQQLEAWAPSHWQAPSGSRIRIDYSQHPPVLAVRLQEVFGLTDTPTLAGGRIATVMHLLSPAHRPVQITQDLATFWQQSYFEVKKELKGRYPKHYWPDDPLTAAPTARAKPRR